MAKFYPDADTTARPDKFEQHATPFLYKYAFIHAKTLLMISLDNDLVTDGEKESHNVGSSPVDGTELCAFSAKTVDYINVVYKHASVNTTTSSK